MEYIAVLTGDLVASTARTRPNIDIAFAALGRAAKRIRHWQNADPRLTRSRGDGWQLYLSEPALALRAALLARAVLRADADIATRIAIAEGRGTLGDGPDLNDASGAAFTASGRALDALSSAAMAHAAGGALGAATRLADHISAGWTPAQAAAIAHALEPDTPTQARIGAALGKSRQAVAQALAAAGFPALDDALRMIEKGAPC